MYILKLLQERYTPTMYMHTQSDVNPNMRRILIDWLNEVHLRFKLKVEVLYLACHILDRYCMLEQVHKNKLQLVGVTALLIASKYEEIWPIELRDCVYLTDSAYTREEVLDMEGKILKRLNWQITVSTTSSPPLRGFRALMCRGMRGYSHACTVMCLKLNI